jgi:hypothetical protein
MHLLTLATMVVGSILSLNSANAGEVKGVVELFTSQGCSSCPPADKVLSQIASQGGVLALAFHVDYWDRLGWKDTFSSKAHTQRQRGYGNGFNTNTIYTPQFIVNGYAVPQSGSSQGIRASIGELGVRGHRIYVPLKVSVTGSQLTVEAGEGNGAANLILVSYVSSKTVDIGRGENAGRKIEYRNAVTGARNIGKWNGKKIIVETAKPAGAGLAVLLQRTNASGGPGEIIGAYVLSGNGS